MCLFVGINSQFLNKLCASVVTLSANEGLPTGVSELCVLSASNVCIFLCLCM